MLNRRTLLLSLAASFGSIATETNPFVLTSQAEERTASAERIGSEQARLGLRRGTEFMTQIAVHGGFVYSVTADWKQRFGEGKATATEIWVQPPGTPTVGMAFLNAWRATGDELHREAALAAAHALVYGQLQSGGWSDRIDFEPSGREANRYRNGKGSKIGKNYSTLDDDKSQSALCFLMEVDRELGFQDQAIHDCVTSALDALLSAQFSNGGFPQGWQGPVAPIESVRASYPQYEWRTEGRFKNYWDFPTLNDGLAGTVSRTLEQAYQTYREERFRQSLIRLGDFLILAQMPEPQPAWAQQYNLQMQPMWARKFEPPAIVGRESEDAIETLLFIHRTTGETRFLEPIPAAIAWLKRSQLPDGKIARFYELQTNRPLYFVKDSYELTYDDINLPTHYGFKTNTRVESLDRKYESQRTGTPFIEKKESMQSLAKRSKKILELQDASGRWLLDASGKPVKRLSTEQNQSDHISSQEFAKNMDLLSNYFKATSQAPDAGR